MRKEERALRIGQLRPGARAGALTDPPEHIVERPDRPAEKSGLAPEQVAFYPVDVRPVGDNQKRVPVEGLEVAIEQTRHLARVRGAHQESERHASILDVCPASTSAGQSVGAADFAPKFGA
jgi:hypothetical protein